MRTRVSTVSSSSTPSRLTIKEAAAYVRACEKTLRRAVKAGLLPEHRIGNGRGDLRFLIADLDTYLSCNRAGIRRVSSQPPSPAPTCTASEEALRLIGIPPSLKA